MTNIGDARASVECIGVTRQLRTKVSYNKNVVNGLDVIFKFKLEFNHLKECQPIIEEVRTVFMINPIRHFYYTANGHQYV